MPYIPPEVVAKARVKSTIVTFMTPWLPKSAYFTTDIYGDRMQSGTGSTADGMFPSMQQ